MDAKLILHPENLWENHDGFKDAYDPLLFKAL